MQYYEQADRDVACDINKEEVMRILKDAAKKIRAFNSLPYDNTRDYRLVLLAREEEESLVGRGGNASNKILVMIGKALSGYFMMNRGNRMGSEEEFVNKHL